MIRKAEQNVAYSREAMRGGAGSVIFRDIATPEEMFYKARLFTKITLKPGCGIGYHEHHGECEIYLITKGTAVYNDNGVETIVSAGDVTITLDGQGHAAENRGTEDVEIIALIPLQ